MCGIGGFFALERQPANPVSVLQRMTESMRNRGPNGHGIWIDASGQIGLAHRRLAVVDPTTASNQPMHSADRALTLVFNGEIYNYRALRDLLQKRGYRFRTRGDTEVLLHLYDAFGEDMLDHLRGMYAFALWDGCRQRLLVARDPLGIKPMYYAEEGGVLYLASQVKTLRPMLSSAEPDPAGRVGFLLWGSVPEPYTFYRGIRALPAGHRMLVERGKPPRLIAGETVADVFSAAAAAPAPAEEQRAEMLHAALAETTAAHGVADVPLALFLSAGRDSTTLAGLASEIPAMRLQALTLSFDEVAGSDEDETPLARLVAAQYGIPFFAETIGKDTFAEHYECLLDAMDQPTIDGVNVYFVSRMARRAGYKVALSGVGGDELFAGYPSFHQVPRIRQLCGWAGAVPWLGRAFRRVSAAAVRRRTSPKFAGLLEYGHTLGGSYLLRRGLYMPWELPQVMDPEMAAEGLATLAQVPQLQQFLRPMDGSGITDRVRVSALELSMYLRNQLLRDADWAGMSNSVEIRVPFVDWTLLRQLAPLLVHGAAPTKADMALAPSHRLPESILHRPKTGFVVPVRDWLTAGLSSQQPERGLRGWARHLEGVFA